MNEQTIQRYGLIIGATAAIIAVIGLFIASPAEFFQIYLYAYIFWLGLTLGAMTIAFLYYLVGGNWGAVSRAIAEAGTKTLWLLALLFIPIIVGAQHIYPWARPEVVANDALLQHKSIYLNLPFFIGRAALYFGLWIFFSQRLTSWMLQEEFHKELEERRRFQRWSAFGLIVYMLTISFASIDWIMSIQPDWWSTIFGMLIALGHILSGFALILLVLPFIARRKPIADVITPTHYRDIGAFMLSMVVGWAYLGYSQYFIIWYGNLPHEVTWYLTRANGGWSILAVSVYVLQFGLPFLFLISLQVKRNPRLLQWIALLILIMRLVDNYWMVIPAFRPEGFAVHWLDFILPIAMGGFWVWLFLRHLQQRPKLITLKSGIKIEADVKNSQTA